MNVEQYVEEIKNRLKQEGYIGKKIDYSELQDLHRTYGSDLPEKEFALFVLELGRNNYSGVKNGNNKTMILQEQLKYYIEQQAENIRNQLLLQGNAGKLADLAEIQRLHQIYAADIPESVFVKQILDISKSSYDALRGGRRGKVYILRNLQKESPDELDEIKKKIQADGYVGKKISYEELKELHKTYGMKISESRFAQRVLEIGESSYLSAKNHETNVIILNSLIGKSSEEEIQAIINNLNADGYTGKTIDYKELQRLHQIYGKQMIEREFAQKVLELTYSYYYNMRNNPKKRAVILKSFLPKRASSQEIEEIKEKVKEQGYVGKKINYEELQHLYQTFGSQLTEKEFASEVLGIKNANYSRLKNTSGNTTALHRRAVHLSLEEINNIKEQLRKQEYVGKTIDYDELIRLHQLFAAQTSEKEFATSILEIGERQYAHMKYENNKAVILKSLIIQTSKEEIERIKALLIEQNYANSMINYGEFQTLHKTYAVEMTESVFAQEVLGIVYPTYIGLKNNSKRRTTILKDDEEKEFLTPEEIESIKEQLLLQGYAGKSIQYSELQSLHQMYASQMPEDKFARDILEITYSQYQIAKRGQGNAVVLKNYEVHTTAEEIEKIKEQMRLDGYSDSYISYNESQELHKKYGNQLTEREFAQKVLGIDYNSYSDLKSEKHKTVKILVSMTASSEQMEEIKLKNDKVAVLKTEENTVSSADKENIRRRLIEADCAGRLIDYKELQGLHQTYGSQMTEIKFAQDILGITYKQYMRIKADESKVVILKDISDSIERQKIQKLKETIQVDGYAGKSINYEQLIQLHMKYGEQLTEREFANYVLEINPSQFKRMKKGLRNAIILKSLIPQISQEEINNIKQELEMQGYSGKKINYLEFHKLHQMYGSNMPESRFGEDILGISAALVGNMKRLPKARARILKSFSIPISEEEIEAIKEALEEKGYGGRTIGYEEFQKLYQIYGTQMKEDVFAQVVLECPNAYAYQKMKEEKRQTQILCSNKRIELIRGMLFNESRWYTKEEIEKICLDNNVSLDKLIRQVASNGTNQYNENYKRALEQKGKLWIGKTRLSNEFVEKNYRKIMEKAKFALRSVKHRFGITDTIDDDDMIQDAVLWLIESAGEAEKNFKEEPNIMEQRIFNTLRKSILYKIIKKSSIIAKTRSLNERLTPKQKRDKTKEGDELGNRIASDYNTEEEALERIDDRNGTDGIVETENEEELATRCIQDMKTQIEAGLSRQQVLSNTAKKFGLSQAELLEIMQSYLITKGKVKINNGRASWKQDDEER